MNIVLIFNRLLRNTNLKQMKYCNTFRMEIYYLLYLEYHLKKERNHRNKKKPRLYFVELLNEIEMISMYDDLIDLLIYI